MRHLTTNPSPPSSEAADHPPFEPLTGGAACQFLVELAMAGVVAYAVLNAALALL